MKEQSARVCNVYCIFSDPPEIRLRFLPPYWGKKIKVLLRQAAAGSARPHRILLFKSPPVMQKAQIPDGIWAFW